MIGNSNDETNFPHNVLLINRQVPNLCKALANNLWTDMPTNTRLAKMI